MRFAFVSTWPPRRCGMAREALSARQADSLHIQGMLNVAFTRARDEIHVFHSAPIDQFFKSDGAGKIGEWLRHIADVEQRPRDPGRGSRLGTADSQFEIDVAEELGKRGVSLTHQYPACGYFIDLVGEMNGRRIGIECDGPTHFDEHGNTRLEDLERLAVLRRAGWTIINISFREWQRKRGACLDEVLTAFRSPEVEGKGSTQPEPAETLRTLPVPRAMHVVFESLRSGLSRQDDVLKAAGRAFGYQRVTEGRKKGLLLAAIRLQQLGLVSIEDGEIFLTAKGRQTSTFSID